MAVPIQSWEVEALRSNLSPVVQASIKALAQELAVPINVVEHVLRDHPKDAQYLDVLREVIESARYFETNSENSAKLVVYCNYDQVWFRIIIIRSTESDAPSILVSLYRRNARKVEKAIQSGRLTKISGEE